MATKSELWTQLSYAVKIVDEMLKFGNANTPNLLSMLDTLTQSLEGDHSPNTLSAGKAFRSSVAGLASNQAILQYILVELAKVGYNSKASSAKQALEDIKKGMILATETVLSRGWTYGSLTTGGSNVGTGTVYRLTKELNDDLIELGTPGITKILIYSDKNTGSTAGNEKAKISGDGQNYVDALDIGTAPSAEITLAATRPQDGKLSNPSFTTYTGTGASLAVTGWVLNDNTKVAMNTSIYFRSETGTTPVSIELTDNTYITQYMDSMTSKISDTSIPVFLIFRYYRKDSCDGTLTISLGSQTNSVSLSSVTNATWYDLAIAVDKKTYYDNFKENPSPYLGARIKAALTSRTTGSLILDDVILAQPTLYDGKYYLLTSGQSNFLKDDYFTFTDSVTNTGRIQTTLTRIFGVSLPHASSSPTYDDA